MSDFYISSITGTYFILQENITVFKQHIKHRSFLINVQQNITININGLDHCVACRNRFVKNKNLKIKNYHKSSELVPKIRQK